MLAIVVSGLFIVFAVLAFAGVVIHIRVLMQAKPGTRPLLKKALMRHNWTIAAEQLEPAGQAELLRLRILIDWMFRAGGAAFMVVVIVALFGGGAALK